jgi:medium-chain acyl-[acyl-carrier-protein] hydrolase
MVFRNWTPSLPPSVEVYAVELPGRGKRIMEPPFTQLDPLVQTLAQELAPHLHKPFMCFGHSLGGLIAFELSRLLHQNYQLKPTHLWVSATRAPHLRAPTPPIHALPDADFIAELRRYNGTPITVLNNAELMALMLPTLRADFSVLETYHSQSENPTEFPITAFWGEQDAIVSQDEVAAWQAYTTTTFSLQPLPGDHFFVHQPLLLQRLSLQLSLVLGVEPRY